MTVSIENSSTQNEIPPFPSLEAMRYIHGELLKRQREYGLQRSRKLQEEVEDFIACAQATGALLKLDRDRSTAQTLIDYWVTALYRLTHVDMGEPTLADFDERSLKRQLADDQYPYHNISSAPQGKPVLAVGTRRIVEECTDRLEYNQLVALAGPVGSGRSYILYRGLLPALREGQAFNSRHWRLYPVITLESDPLGALASLFCPEGVDPQKWNQRHAEQMRQQSSHLADLAGEPSGEPALIAIDRFESLFTCGDKVSRKALIDNLLDFVQRPGAGAVVLVIDSEFLSQIDHFPEFAAVFQQGLTYLAFTTDELRQAIQEPAQIVGLEFDEGLVDRIILDIQGDPAALTLLQFTLRKLWEHRRGNFITWDAYNRLGGGRRALERAAEEVYQNLSADDQSLATAILLRIVRPGAFQETEIQTVPLRDLQSEHGDPARVDRIVEAFVRAGLLRYTAQEPAAERQITFSHVALASHWPRLVEWLGEMRHELRRRLRVTEAAQTWLGQDRSFDALWRGSLLEEAEQYTDLSELETEFVAASRRAVDEAQRASEAALRHEAEQARALAKAEQSRARFEKKYRLLASLLAAGFAIAAMIAGLMYYEADAARVNELEQSIELKGVHGNQLLENGDSGGAALWFQEALRQSHGLPESRQREEVYRRRLTATFSQQPILTRLWKVPTPGANSDRIQADVLAVNADGTLALASVSEPDARESRGHLYDLQSGVKRDDLITHEDGRIRCAAFDPAGRFVATGSQPTEGDGVVRIWNLASPQKPIEFTSAGRVNWLAFSHDGNLLAVASGEPGGDQGALQLRTAADQFATNVLSAWENKGPVHHVDFGPRDALLGNHLIIAGAGMTGGGWVEVMNADDQTVVTSIPHEVVVNRAVFSPNGEWILTAAGEQGSRGESQLWQRNDEIWTQVKLFQHPDGVTWADFSPGHEYLLTACQNGTVTLRSLDQPDKPLGMWLFTWQHGSSVYQAGFIGNGESLKVVSVSRDQTARIWDVTTRQLALPPLHHQAPVSQAFFDEQRGTLVTLSKDTVRQWRLATQNAAPTDVAFAGTTIHDLFLSADGKQIAAASEIQPSDTGTSDAASEPEEAAGKMSPASTAAFWPAAGGTSKAQINEKSGKLTSISLSPDARRAAAIVQTTEDDVLRQHIQLWTLANKEPRSGRSIPIGQEQVNQTRFSPDGKLLALAFGNIGSDGAAAVCWLAEKDKPLAWSEPHKGGVLAVAFNARSNLLVTASSDDSARVWRIDAKRLTPMGRPMLHSADVVSAAFSGDGSRIITASMDQTAVIWDVRAAKRLATLPHASYVIHARFSNDGRFVVTAAQDGKARVWFLAEDSKSHLKAQLVALLEHGEGLQQAAFLKTGNQVVTVGYLMRKTFTVDVDEQRDTIRSRVWEISAGEPPSVVPVLAARQFDRDRQELTPLSPKKLLELWDIGRPKYQKRQKAAVSSDKSELMAAGQRN